MGWALVVAPFMATLEKAATALSLLLTQVRPQRQQLVVV
jgi:hypothetical protein